MAGEGFENYRGFCFQFAFASAAATIVSGCVAECSRIEFYMFFSLFMTGFIYSFIVILFIFNSVIFN